ncbi:MAG: hypothetical protein UU76_C0003G0007 [Parcubacteria group bacterium GW2011_GWC1_41_7]|nr:MAG: hypothetical protein UU76_C0003G0007 [Parcubacteria group bacterium GW2011_GWC1_41_7]
MKLDPWYITGISEREAAFTYSIASKKRVNLYFAIRLTHTDALLLKEIKDFFGVGNIYHVKASKLTSNSDNINRTEYYRVTNLNDLAVIVRHFDAYPIHGRKKHLYEIWKNIYLLKQEDNISQNVLWRLVYALSLLTTKNQNSFMKKSFTEKDEQNG